MSSSTDIVIIARPGFFCTPLQDLQLTGEEIFDRENDGGKMIKRIPTSQNSRISYEETSEDDSRIFLFWIFLNDRFKKCQSNIIKLQKSKPSNDIQQRGRYI